jgi:hypothetical protein
MGGYKMKVRELEEGPKYYAEVVPRLGMRLIMKDGDKSAEFFVPRRYLAAVYEAMLELVRMEGLEGGGKERKTLELLPKTAPPQAPKQGLGAKVAEITRRITGL